MVDKPKGQKIKTASNLSTKVFIAPQSTKVFIAPQWTKTI